MCNVETAEGNRDEKKIGLTTEQRTALTAAYLAGETILNASLKAECTVGTAENFRHRLREQGTKLPTPLRGRSRIRSSSKAGIGYLSPEVAALHDMTVICRRECELVKEGDVALWRGNRLRALAVRGHHVDVELEEPLEGEIHYTISRYDLKRRLDAAAYNGREEQPIWDALAN